MNNKRSPVEQMVQFGLLSLAAFFLWRQFSGNPNVAPSPTQKTPQTLAQAFEKLDGKAAPPSKDAALKEIAGLQTQIVADPKADYSTWANLRVGLLQQYVLGNAVEARKAYDEVINRQKKEAIDAQAIYQKGDLAWRQSKSSAPLSQAATPAGAANTSGQVSPADQKAALETEGAQAFEQIPLRARGHADFLQNKIWVPDVNSWRGDPLQLPKSWEQLSLDALLGKGSTLASATSSNADPRAILPRIDGHYAPTPLYKVFDTVVKWYGDNPAFSYGLALITLALCTRLIMQPLIKKQYASMKGMQLIAPEMKKIQDRYKGKSDQESQVKMMKEIREVQKLHGVNPLGCGLSLVVQMPLFFFIVLPLINHYQARMELSGAHFAWIKSLAHPDIPLLVLYAISMFISVRLSATPPADEQQAQMQKMTTFMSPMFALVLWSYPSAFILYWFTYNTLSTALQWRMMKAGDPTKSAIKSLLGGAATPMMTGAPAESEVSSDSIPPRPNGKKQSAKTVALSQEDAFDLSLDQNPNGKSKNGANANGQAEYSPLQTPGDANNSNGNAASNSSARRRRRRK